MSRLLTLSLLFPGVAVAAPLEWGLDGAQEVEISGTVEVPLVRWDKGVPAVWATGPIEADKPAKAEFLLAVDLASGWTRLDEATAKALGGEIKTSTILGTKKQKYTVIPELRIAGLVLHDVRALVLPGAPTLGAGTLPELATAILPSEGVVKFVPAADAAALLASLGVSVAVQRVPAVKWFEYGAEKYGNGLGVSVAGKMFGREGQVRLRSADLGTTTKADPPASSAGFPTGGLPSGIAVITLGGVDAPAVTVVKDGGISDPADAIIGVAGWSTLHAFDLAFSPATNQLALRLATASKGADPRAAALVVAKRDHDEALAPPTDTGKGDPKPEPVPEPVFGVAAKPEAGAHGGLAAAHEAVGDYPAAIALWQQAVSVAGDDCSPYLGLGEALLASGDAAGALVPLQRAGELWERWAGQSDEMRRLIALKREPAGAFVVAQAPSCAGAWADLARAELALGAHPAVERLWTEHRAAKDPSLAHAYGVALLRAGKVAEAGGPLREAVNGGERANPAVRAALALSVAKTDVAGALPALKLQVERIASSGLSLPDLLPVVELARALGGDAAAAEIAHQALVLRPLSPPAALLAWREAPKGGNSAAAAAVAQRNATRIAAVSPFAADAVAAMAVAKALGGDPAGARVDLDAHPDVSGDWFVASALVAEAAGDFDRARAELSAASKRGLLVLVAPETFTAPPPPPAPELPPEPAPAPEPPTKKTR